MPPSPTLTTSDLLHSYSLIASEATTGFNASYYQSLAFDKELGATNGIDAALKLYSLDALVLPAPGLVTVPAGKSRHRTTFISIMLITHLVPSHRRLPHRYRYVTHTHSHSCLRFSILVFVPLPVT